MTLCVELARGHRRHLARRAAMSQRAAALSRQRVAVAVPLAAVGAAPGSAGLDAAGKPAAGLTAELGCVTPWIVAPGAWTDTEALKYCHTEDMHGPSHPDSRVRTTRK